MTMTFFLHESIQPSSPINMIGQIGAATVVKKRPTGEFPLLLGKLRAPETDGIVERERLATILERSRSQFPATMISGRAGTGKTALAAHFASKQRRVGWYTVDTTDVDWATFSRYFECCLSDAGFRATASSDEERYSPQNAIARFLVRHLLTTDKQTLGSNSLIVLDDVQHIFDAEWFGEFFRLLLYSLPPSAHLVILCRSQPPSPLWRLRSKQVLNVIDEEQLEFTTEETAQLFQRYGRRDIGPEAARMECFGRASKLIELVNEGRVY
jgi:LuxR family maltose regulon positive regulatory protein